eukprot:7339804-Prymnesium_polylepis.2
MGPFFRAADCNAHQPKEMLTGECKSAAQPIASVNLVGHVGHNKYSAVALQVCDWVGCDRSVDALECERHIPKEDRAVSASEDRIVSGCQGNLLTVRPVEVATTTVDA